AADAGARAGGRLFDQPTGDLAASAGAARGQPRARGEAGPGELLFAAAPAAAADGGVAGPAPSAPVCRSGASTGRRAGAADGVRAVAAEGNRAAAWPLQSRPQHGALQWPTRP